MVDTESQAAAQYVTEYSASFHRSSASERQSRKMREPRRKLPRKPSSEKMKSATRWRICCLWTHEIRTEVIDNTRMYFINESPQLAFSAGRRSAKDSRRKPDVPSSFSALQGLMPGRNPKGRRKRLVVGWRLKREIESCLVLESVENLASVFIRFDLLENLLNLALFIDEKSGALHAHVGSSHKLFLALSAVSVCDGVIRISQQGKGQLVFFGEFLVRRLPCPGKRPES